MRENQSQPNLSRKLLYIVVPLFLILLGWFGWMIKDTYFPPAPIHYHAGFIVIKDNKIVDFSNIKYMHAKPCGKTQHRETPEEKQIDKGHLHDFVADVVHVHIDGAKWKDLFTNLKYPIDYTATEAYINGEKVTDFQNQPIGPYQSVVIFVGKNKNINEYLEKAVTRSHIEEIEKKSDNCGS